MISFTPSDAILDYQIHIKDLVSGEVLKGRPIYGSEFEFKPVAKCWWAMNNKPPVVDSSDSIWRRLKLIPFYRKFEDHEKDEYLPEKLLKELPGILNWALVGLKRLRENGKFTESIAATVEAYNYRTENNTVLHWLSVRTTVAESPDQGMMASELYRSYRNWCYENKKDEPVSVNTWAETLRSKKFVKKRVSSGLKWDIRALTEDKD